jgi:glycosyltransferase involved in cell wall biosynthesis
MTDRLRVAVVNKHPSDVMGGSEMQTDMIACGLHGRGHAVTYGAVGGRHGAYDVPYRVLPLGPDFRRDFRRFLVEAQPDVIYWRHNKRRLLTAVRLAKQFRVPFVFGVSHVRDVTPWAASSKPPVQKRGLRTRTLGRARWVLQTLDGRLNYLALGMVDGATTLNRDFLERLPVKNRLHLPNAVPKEAVPFSWPRPFVLWVANVKASKHPEAYIEVAARCGDLPIDFLMVGRVAQEYYKDLLASPALPPNLRYLGARTPQEVNGMLRESLFLVHTCYPEGFGNIFIQAWQAGRPTLSLHFDPETLIERWHVGYHSKDMDTLVRRVRELAVADGIREEMGARAIELGWRYSVEQTVTRIEEFLAHTVRRSGGAPSRPEVGGERR